MDTNPYKFYSDANFSLTPGISYTWLRSLAALSIAITKTFFLHIGIGFEEFSFTLCYFLEVFGT
ncbi:hypothetical protein [Nostoc sp.]